MLGTYGSLLGQMEVYPRFFIVEGSGTRIKYIVSLEFVSEVIYCDIVLVVIVFLVLLVVLILVLRFYVVVAPPPPPP